MQSLEEKFTQDQKHNNGSNDFKTGGSADVTDATDLLDEMESGIENAREAYLRQKQAEEGGGRCGCF